MLHFCDAVAAPRVDSYSPGRVQDAFTITTMLALASGGRWFQAFITRTNSGSGPLPLELLGLVLGVFEECSFLSAILPVPSCFPS